MLHLKNFHIYDFDMTLLLHCSRVPLHFTARHIRYQKIRLLLVGHVAMLLHSLEQKLRERWRLC